MKKIFFMMLFSFALTVLSANASYARAPGCSPEMLERQQNYNEAMRVRNKAYSQQVIKKNDSGVGTGCLDRKIALSTILGNMFSEVVPDDDVYSGDFSNIFGMTGSNPSMGFGNGQLLVQVMGQTIMPMLQNHIGNFGGTLSELLGANILGGVWNTINSTVNTTMGQIQSTTSQIQTTTNSINNTMNTIRGFLNAINTFAMPSAVAGVISIIDGLWDTIYSVVNGTLRTLVRQLQTLVRNLMNQIMNQIMSLLGLNQRCDFLAQLWRTGSVSVVGKGVTAGVPYINVRDMLRGTPIAGAGQDLQRALGNDSAVLQRALQDLTNGNLPGQIPGWPATPNINGNMSVNDILNQIR